MYIRLAEDTNARAYPATGRLTEIRTGSAHGATVIAVGPMLDRVLAATDHLDVTVLYIATVRPFDAVGLCEAANGRDVVLIEPYLEGTSAAEVSKAFRGRGHRLLSIGVPYIEHRHFGTRHHHAAAHGLDVPGLRAGITAFLDPRVDTR